MSANPARPLLTAPVEDLLNLLVRQFARLLHEQDVALTTEHSDAIIQAAASHQPLPPGGDAVVEALARLVTESEQELQTRFSLDFATALKTTMNDIDGWQTTADFLEMANYKSNAELRISAGSALLLLLDDSRFAHHALTVIVHDGGVMDVDATIARRALCHNARIDPLGDDWWEAVQRRFA
jgi:hypothetical protein